VGWKTGVLKIGSPVLSPRLSGPQRHAPVHGFGGSLRPTLTNDGRPNQVQVEKDMDGVKPSVTFDEICKVEPGSRNV
jgi:hypothetical protein